MVARVLKKLILICAVSHLLGFVSYAQEESLTLWIMPNEPPLVQKPTDEEIERFVANNPNLKNTLQELKSDSEFSRTVLGQSKILELINRYQKEKGVRINLRILKWPNAFGEIEDAAVSYKEWTSPDIVQLGTTWIAYFAHKKALVEIKGWDESLFFEPSINSCKILGSEKIYGLPLNVDVRTLYYWKDIIKNPMEDLRGWDTLKKTCSRIQGLIDEGKLEGMIAPIGFPTAKDWDLLHQFSIWNWAFGGEIVRFKKMLGIFPLPIASLDSCEALDAALFLRDLTKDSSLPELYLGEIEERFLNRDFGMIISGEWMVRRLKDKLGEEWDEQVGITLPPAGPSGRFTFVGGSNLAIFKSAKHRGNLKEVFEFLHFLLSKEQQIAYAAAVGAFPALKSAMNEYISNNPSYHIFKEAIEHGRSYLSIPEWASVVEKEMTLNNLHRLWKHIIGQQEIKMIRVTLKIANEVLNDELGISLTKIKLVFPSIIIIMVLGGVVFL